MNKFEKFRLKTEEYIALFSSSTAINALKNGMIAILQLTMIGSIFLLIAQFPVSNWSEMIFVLPSISFIFDFIIVILLNSDSKYIVPKTLL